MVFECVGGGDWGVYGKVVFDVVVFEWRRDDSVDDFETFGVEF